MTVDKKLKPYVWKGDFSPLSVDTLVFKDSTLKQLMSENIAPDYNTVTGRALYGGLYYNICIDTLESVSLLRCYHPCGKARDFYEYAKRLIDRDEDDISFRDMAGVFGYIVINDVPILISGSAAGNYFKKEGTVQMSNPYPADAVIYDDSGLPKVERNPEYFVFGPDYFIITSYVYVDGMLEDYSDYSRAENREILIDVKSKDRKSKNLVKDLWSK